MDLDTGRFSVRKDFFNKVMMGKNVTPITASEQLILKQTNKLKEIQRYHDLNLSSFVFDDLANCVFPDDAIKFLVESYKKGLDGYAIDIMEACQRHNRRLSFDDLMESLTIVATGMRTPMITVELLGEEVVDKNTKRYAQKQSINLGNLHI